MKKVRFISFLLLISFSLCVFSQTQSNVTTTDKKEDLSITEKVGKWYMNNLNYGTITLLMTVESSFIPFPSEIVIPPAAYEASKPDGKLNIILVVLFGTLGALIGALINYYLALWLGRPIIHKFAESKLGKMCLLSAEKVQKAEDYFVKHGKSSTFIGRLVPGIRQLISLPAGLARMKLITFMIFTSLGAGIWNAVLAFLGYIAHGQADMFEKYSHELSIAMLVLGVLFVAYLLYNGFIKKNKKSKSE